MILTSRRSQNRRRMPHKHSRRRKREIRHLSKGITYTYMRIRNMKRDNSREHNFRRQSSFITNQQSSHTRNLQRSRRSRHRYPQRTRHNHYFTLPLISALSATTRSLDRMNNLIRQRSSSHRPRRILNRHNNLSNRRLLSRKSTGIRPKVSHQRRSPRSRLRMSQHPARSPRMTPTSQLRSPIKNRSRSHRSRTRNSTRSRQRRHRRRNSTNNLPRTLVRRMLRMNIPIMNHINHHSMSRRRRQGSSSHHPDHAPEIT